MFSYISDLFMFSYQLIVTIIIVCAGNVEMFVGGSLILVIFSHGLDNIQLFTSLGF